MQIDKTRERIKSMSPYLYEENYLFSIPLTLSLSLQGRGDFLKNLFKKPLDGIFWNIELGYRLRG